MEFLRIRKLAFSLIPDQLSKQYRIFIQPTWPMNLLWILWRRKGKLMKKLILALLTSWRYSCCQVSRWATHSTSVMAGHFAVL